MKIIFINPPSLKAMDPSLPKVLQEEEDPVPPLGLMYLAAYLEKYSANDIKIWDCQLEQINHRRLQKKLETEKPDAVCISTMTFTLPTVIESAKVAKAANPQTKIILGGPHIHIYPDETIAVPEVDFLVTGEGEIALKGLIENLHNPEEIKKVAGLVFKLNGEIIKTGQPEIISDLDSLPFPARHLLPYKKYRYALAEKSPITTMFTSRGCPFNCLFCNRPHLGKTFRARSAKNVVDEMELCAKIGIGEIFIFDDTFTVDRQRVVDICGEILKRRLDICWDVRARVDTVDMELLRLMKKAGCIRIHFGVEAGTEKILKVLRKGITIPKAVAAFKASAQAGIKTLAYFMIGSPTETKEDILETISVAKKLNPDFVNFSITTPFPATDLYIMGLKNGQIKNDYWKEFAKNPSLNFKPPVWEENLTEQQLNKLSRKAYRSFYFRPAYIFKTLINLKSFEEFARKLKAGLKIFKI